MKTFWAFVLLIAIAFLGCIVTGCAGGKLDRQQTCETAQAAYEAYQATLAIREPSKEEVIAAAGAGVFLRLQCGWVSPKTRGQSPAVDKNGVLILKAP